MAFVSNSRYPAMNSAQQENFEVKTVEAKRPASATSGSTTPRGTAARPTMNLSGGARRSSSVSALARPTAAGAKVAPLSSAASSSSSSSSSSSLTGPGSIKRANSSSTVSRTSVPGKRPAWDVKGRLEDMEMLHSTLLNQIHSTDEHVATITSQLQQKQSEITQVVQDKEGLSREYQRHKAETDRLMQQNKELAAESERLRAKYGAEMDGLQARCRQLEAEMDGLRSQLEQSLEEGQALRVQLAQQTSHIASAQAVINEAQRQLESSMADATAKGGRIDELIAQVTAQQVIIAELEARKRSDEMLRRKLHNTIQELKGNIRVYARVRPASAAEDGTDMPYAFPDGTDDRVMEVTAAPEKNVRGQEGSRRKWNFNFDKIFGPSATQADVFEEVSQLVQSALDGYHVSLFTYGQTGSGKTYTMEGPGKSATDETRGVIPRAVAQVFETARALQELGWQFVMDCSFLEIYNETLRDLLTTNPAVATASDYKIIHDASGTTNVPGLTIVRVVEPAQVFDLLQRAQRVRATGATKLNERSSRSHSVFQLRLVGKNTITGDSASGLLNLIDLAGSERVKDSGATGERLKEAQNINKSLSCLGDVIAALANKDAHVPYRNSKLTYLLQNSLGGSSSKTLMFVNVSPLMRDINESLSSLRFATKVNACEIGTAKKQGAGRVDLASAMQM